MNEETYVKVLELLREMAVYAPPVGVVCAPTAQMGFGWKAAAILRELGETPPNGCGGNFNIPVNAGVFS